MSGSAPWTVSASPSWVRSSEATGSSTRVTFVMTTAGDVAESVAAAQGEGLLCPSPASPAALPALMSLAAITILALLIVAGSSFTLTAVGSWREIFRVALLPPSPPLLRSPLSARARLRAGLASRAAFPSPPPPRPPRGALGGTAGGAGAVGGRGGGGAGAPNSKSASGARRRVRLHSRSHSPLTTYTWRPAWRASFVLGVLSKAEHTCVTASQKSLRQAAGAGDSTRRSVHACGLVCWVAGVRACLRGDARATPAGYACSAPERPERPRATLWA